MCTILMTDSGIFIGPTYSMCAKLSVPTVLQENRYPEGHL